VVGGSNPSGRAIDFVLSTMRKFVLSILPGLSLIATCAAPYGAHAAAPHPAAALVESSERQMRRDPEASHNDAERALARLAGSPHPDLELRARQLLCDYYSERDINRAAAELSAMEGLLPSLKQRGLEAGARICRGLIAESRGDNTAARTSYDAAVRIAEEAGEDDLLADALYSRGYLLGQQGDYANGLADLRRSQALFERAGKPLHALTTLNGIAIVYNRMGDTVQAESIYKRALLAQRSAGLKREETVTQYNLGRAAENLHNWSQARAAFEASLRLARDLDYRRAEVYALRGLAAVAVAENKPHDALGLLREARPMLAEVPDARLAGQVALTEGSALRLLGRAAESRAMLEQARGVMEEGDSQGDLVGLFDEMALLESAQNDWRSAFAWRSRARDVSEGLLRRQIDQRFATLKVEFDTVTKEKENAALVKANEANELALEQTRRARALQAIVIALAILLTVVLAALALHQRRSSLRMRKLALTDELTEAPNRRAVLGRLHDLLAIHPPRSLCLMLLDIDHFKSINDRFGHPAGDKVLRAVATRLRASLQTGDLHGRIGGEEFLVAAPGETLEAALARAEVLRFQFTTIDTSAWCEPGHTLTVSIGVAERHADDTASSLLQRADAALYEAKRTGRNCVRHAPAPGARRTAEDHGA
jgi:diguanylate cyclase (GGDEF)-like protein